MKITGPRVTLREVPALITLGEAAIAAGDGEFDFTDVRSGDSSAVALLLRWKRKCVAKGVRFSVHSLPDSLKDLCRLYQVQALVGLPEQSR